MIASGEASLAILFMAAGVFLTVIFFVAAALVVVGYFKPSARLRKAGWLLLVVWSIPAAIWLYYLIVFTERDQYRTLLKPEVVYGVPLPAGSQVNFRRWARRVQWATLPKPQAIQGVEYTVEVSICGRRVCSGTLARDQDIQGLPCRAQTEIHYSDKTGDLTWCTVSRPSIRQGVTWPAGTTMILGLYERNSYLLPEGADPVAVAGVLVHSGLTVVFTLDGQIREIHRNESRNNPDTRLETGDIVLKSDEYHFQPDGAIRGGVLERDAVVNGKLMKAGEPVMIPRRAVR